MSIPFSYAALLIERLSQSGSLNPLSLVYLATSCANFNTFKFVFNGASPNCLRLDYLGSSYCVNKIWSFQINY